MNVFFILGSGHCGSTLLDMILGAHSDIAGVGELDTARKQINRGERCACGEKISECRLWGPITNKLTSWEGLQTHRNKLDFLLDRDSYYYLDSDQDVDTQCFCTNQCFLYEYIADKLNASSVADSSKNPDRVELAAKCEDIDPVIVHLVRDGRGVLYSFEKKYDRTLAFIWRWIASNIKAEILRWRTDIKYIQIRYKDLVNNTEQTIKKIIEKTNLSYDPEMLSFRNDDQHQVGGNRLRLQSSEEIVEDTEWKNKLDFFSRSLFTLLAGGLNWYYMHENE